MGSSDPSEWVPEWQEWPEHDAWPMYMLGKQARQWHNGREGGAWLAGVVSSIPEKCAKVEIQTDWIAGALVAMVEGGLCVGPYISGGDDSSTFEVWTAYIAWGPERISGHSYVAPHPVGTLVHPQQS